MIPLTPASALTRSKKFVREEWDAYFAPGAVADARNVSGGWRGILHANLALVDPVAAFRFFSRDDFDASWLDGGASRTWYLTLAAGEFSIPPSWALLFDSVCLELTHGHGEGGVGLTD